MRRLLTDINGAYMEFRYLMCKLKSLPSVRYYDSDNIVARLNLPNMAYPPEDRLEMYLAAQTGLAQLETSPKKQRKHADFIDFYADLSEEEVIRYRARYLSEKGVASVLREEGRQEGSYSTYFNLIQNMKKTFLIKILLY